MTIYDEVWSRYRGLGKGVYGARMRARLQDEGVTQGELARVSGYSPTHVSRWLGGYTEPVLETKLHLDEALDLILEGRKHDAD